MDDVGITKGCAIVLVAKIRMMKLNVHSAMPRENASLLGPVLARGAARGAVTVCFLGFFRLMRIYPFYTALSLQVRSPTTAARRGALQCLHACQGIGRVARRDL